ncbi:MAG: cytochrome c3 family protein [Deltaproteobacteria bacterium]|nr:cytochrome c3 family protein [Deltaproteobacteria bacterium]
MSDDKCENSVSSRKACIVLALAVLGTLAIAALAFSPLGFGPAWYQNYAPKQPIPFSHKTHAGQFNIPCLYCHGAAEYAAFAEVPGVETCMNCHSVVKTDSPWIKQVKEAYDTNNPIKWVKVHVLPDFVHFNHKRHIAAGLECETCHGPVKTMDTVYQYSALTMGWCVNCHRDNNYVGPSRAEWTKARDALRGESLKDKPFWFQMLSHPDPHNADVSCSTCHY